MRCALAPTQPRSARTTFSPPPRARPILSHNRRTTAHTPHATPVLPMAAPAPRKPTESSTGVKPAPYPLIMLPLRQTKTIHFIRHGQGFHNVAGHLDHDNYKSEEWSDAHLTAEGWHQAEDLNRHILSSGLQVDLVVVSPLMRALETAVGAFGRKAVDPSSSQPPLMIAQPGDKVHSVAHDAVSTEGVPPFIAHELCREIYGVHPCDRRQPTSAYRHMFPGIDWSLVTDEQDQLWSKDKRETKQSVVERGREFLKFIMQRPESSIAVVTHSTLLHYTLNSFGHDFGPPVQDELHRWFENCEMRSIVVANTVEAMPADRHHFHGGAPPTS